MNLAAENHVDRSIDQKLGWEATETFETGLAKTVRQYCENRNWWQAPLDRSYKAERIGLTQFRRDIISDNEKQPDQSLT